MLFVLSLLLAIVVVAVESSPIDIQCQNADDYYHLMYKICCGQVLCKEIYYLDVPHHNNSVIVEQDFHRFKYQLSLIEFYPTNGTSSTPSHHYHHHHWDGQPLVELVYPSTWQPGITIYYDDSFPTQCSDAFNLTSTNLTTDELQYIYVSLALLQIYKQYVSNEHYCADFNERPIFNPVTGHFICFCTNDKLCNSLPSYRHLIFYVLLLILVAVLLYIFLTYIVSFLLLGK
jgi:hypothetical protein